LSEPLLCPTRGREKGDWWPAAAVLRTDPELVKLPGIERWIDLVHLLL
jgi:hypothetical protein